VAIQSLQGPWSPHTGGLVIFVGLFGRVISPSQRHYTTLPTLPTLPTLTQKHKQKHPCLERDSKPWSQQPSGRDLRFGLRVHIKSISVKICRINRFFYSDLNTNQAEFIDQILLKINCSNIIKFLTHSDTSFYGSSEIILINFYA
jgi:hypothetical protein